jgi:hypothetical protein
LGAEVNVRDNENKSEGASATLTTEGASEENLLQMAQSDPRMAAYLQRKIKARRAARAAEGGAGAGAGGHSEAEAVADMESPGGHQGQGQAHVPTSSASAKTMQMQAVQPPTVRWTQEQIQHMVRTMSPSQIVTTIFAPHETASDMLLATQLLNAQNAWGPTLMGLPSKSGIDHATREALYHLVQVRLLSLPDVGWLFQKRFGLSMTNSNNQAWTYDAVVITWAQLDKLPDEHVTDNNKLAIFNATQGGGGTYAESSNTVNIGQAGLANMSHTVRHEVGHAVHAQLKGIVDPWLEGTMGFHNYARGANGVRQWIDDLGGFPLTYKAEGNWLPSLSLPGRRQRIVDQITSYIGGGSSWQPARPNVLDGHADNEEKGLYNDMPRVKYGVFASPPYWYQNWRNFVKGPDGGSYYLNYWYAHPIRFSAKCAQVIEATGDDYTSMSHYEFFANCYAEYFADPAGAQDPTKWGGRLPGDVKDFITKNILPQRPTTARVKQT